MDSVQVAISPDFLKAFSKIPKTQQKKVREFTEKFRTNPTSSGINYEKLVNSKDPNVRSVRIDDTYRAIVVKPPRGDVYLCAWVAHHDDAIKWGLNKRFEVNPKVGHLQVFEVTHSVEEMASRPVPEAPKIPRLLDEVDDVALEAFGVPPALMPAIRGLRDAAELEQLFECIPVDVYDALYCLACGMSPEEVLEEVGRKELVVNPPPPVDTEDFSAALKKPDSLRSFALVDKQQLAEALTAPLEQWRLFLHPDQKKLVEWEVNGPIRVLGGAGTGKTVALMHRAAFLVKKLGPNERLLVTTFTRNLAVELASQLKSLCADDFSKVEVANLSSWAYRFMRSQGAQMTIGEGWQLEDAWEVALSDADDAYSPKFYREEWEKVVQAQDVVNLSDYFKASRKGRGTGVSRQQKAKIWDVFTKYREQLEQMGICEFADVIREARLKLQSQGGPPPYRFVLADEVQDFRDSELRLLRALAPEAPNDLFLVGDPHQRIYGHKSSLGRCGIAIVGRSRRLKVNYRTTAEIGKLAVSLITGLEYDDMDEGKDNLTGYHAIRSGLPPLVKEFEREAEERNFVLETIESWLKEPGVEPSHICLTTRTQRCLSERYQPLLENAGIDTEVLDKDTPESELDQGAVRLATMHRMKGLEFPRVLMAGTINAPRKLDDFGDRASQEDYDQQERSLSYVAATRARDVLAVCNYGDRKFYVRELAEKLT